MLLDDLQNLDESSLRKLCDDKCPESTTLDFKQSLPGSADKDKQELLKDVCAFANTEGGDLVYGISESEEGCAEDLIPIVGELPDAASRRITQVLDAGLDPRVQGVRIRHVDVEGGYVLVLRVPASFDGPHCVRVNTNRRFVMRNGTTTSDLSFDQLRASFDRTATLAERARQFIRERLQAIKKREGSAPVREGPVWAIHLVPISGLAGRHSVDLQPVHAKGFTAFIDNAWGQGAGRSFNLDGLLVHSGDREAGYFAYTQLFRTGAMEAVSVGGDERAIPGSGNRKFVWSNDMTKFFRGKVAEFIFALKGWGFAGPAVLSVAVLNVEGFELHFGTASRFPAHAVADRPHLIVPEVWLPSLDTIKLDADLDGIVRPMMDVLWQAFNVQQCRDFHPKTGVYNPTS